MKKFLQLLFLMTIFNAGHLLGNPPLKVLHLSFHHGCVKDFEVVANELGLDLTSWYILKSKEDHDKFDPRCPDWNAIYNISHERAERIWQANKDYFNQFDAIITSDTAPLSRVFLQNGWKKPLIIWICNRFDYYDGVWDGRFPDREYYDLMNKAKYQSNVKVVGYVAYEHFYARTRGVDTGNLVIKPCGAVEKALRYEGKSYIPEHVNKSETFFIPPRLQEHQVQHMLNICASLGIKAYCGGYNGPADLKDFKAVIHFPYAWSNLALFENMQLGLAHFVPSIRFLRELYMSQESGNYRFFALDNLEYSEWYCPDNKDAIVYFDSWQDLKHKIETIDFVALREKVRACGRAHNHEMLARWKKVFKELTPDSHKAAYIANDGDNTVNAPTPPARTRVFFD